MDSFTLTYNNEIKVYPFYRLLGVGLDNYAKYGLYLVHVVQGLKLLFFFLNGLLSYYQVDMWSAVCEIAHMATLNREEPNLAQVCKRTARRQNMQYTRSCKVHIADAKQSKKMI